MLKYLTILLGSNPVRSVMLRLNISLNSCQSKYPSKFSSTSHTISSTSRRDTFFCRFSADESMSSASRRRGRTIFSSCIFSVTSATDIFRRLSLYGIASNFFSSRWISSSRRLLSAAMSSEAVCARDLFSLSHRSKLSFSRISGALVA